jgi:hypothetical protein
MKREANPVSNKTTEPFLYCLVITMDTIRGLTLGDTLTVNRGVKNTIVYYTDTKLKAKLYVRKVLSLYGEEFDITAFTDDELHVNINDAVGSLEFQIEKVSIEEAPKDVLIEMYRRLYSEKVEV